MNVFRMSWVPLYLYELLQRENILFAEECNFKDYEEFLEQKKSWKENFVYYGGCPSTLREIAEKEQWRRHMYYAKIEQNLEDCV